MDLDEMLRVDSRDIDELINSGLLSFRYRIGYGTLQPCLGCQRAALLRGILRRENPTYTPLERAVVRFSSSSSNLLAQKHDRVTCATKQIERDSKDTDATNSCPRKV